MMQPAIFTRSGWPDDFDFNTDPVCQTRFKPFIVEQLQNLKTYDGLRPKDTSYIFYDHALRVAKDVREVCLYAGLPPHAGENLYQAVLIHDIGKTALPHDIWDIHEKPSDGLKKQRRTHTTLGANQFKDNFKDIDHPFKTLAYDIILNHHEQMDGGGTHGLEADKISIPVRLAAIVEAFDGWSVTRPHFGDRDVSVVSVLNRMRTEKMHMFDPDLFDVFEQYKLSMI